MNFLPQVSYKEALNEMLGADGLMLFQADNCNDQIPAKVYEYMYSGSPIVGFADPDGDTGKLLQEVGVTTVAKLESTVDIESVLRTFLMQLVNQQSYTVPAEIAQRFSRRSLSGKLSEVLIDAMAPRSNSFEVQKSVAS